MKKDGPQDALFGFLKAVHDSLIEPLKKNQIKLAWQREIKESKRFQDAENKLAEFFEAYNRVKDNFMLHDKVMSIIRTLHATRMSQFIESGKAITTCESDDLQAALAPYFELLKPIDDIRRLQTTMMNQAKLKKLSLAYDEINATLKEVAGIAEKMPGLLTNGIADLSEALEKVA